MDTRAQESDSAVNLAADYVVTNITADRPERTINALIREAVEKQRERGRILSPEEVREYIDKNHPNLSRAFHLAIRERTKDKK